MKRTPIRPRTASMSESELIAYYMREREKQQAATDRAVERLKARRKPVERPDWTIAGEPWPAGFQPESAFQKQVEDTAATFGWIASHSHLPYFDTAGWPDLALLHEKKARFMIRELKVTSAVGRVGKPTPMQWRWLTGLKMAGVDAAVWTWPQDWDRLVRELRA